MNQRPWVAGVVLLCVWLVAMVAAAQEVQPDKPRIVGLKAVPQAGVTSIQIETTTSSPSYIAYSRDDMEFVVDLYGFEVGAIPAEIDVSSAEVSGVVLEPQPEQVSGVGAARFVVRRSSPGTTSVRVEGNVLLIEAGHARPLHRSGSTGSDRRVDSGRATRPASVIDNIHTERTPGDGFSVSIQGDGQLRYESFLLESPPRLVLDFAGIGNRVVGRQFDIHDGPIERIRVSQFRGDPDKVARVVLDLSSVQDYRVRPRGDGVEVRFGTDLDAEAESVSEVGLVVAEARESAQGMPPTPPGGSLEEDSQESTAGGVGDDEGTLISLDLKNADIKDVLRYFSEISGLNIILDPGVSGDITVRLIDVPWNKALDIILKAHGYGRTLDGNVLRIADVGKLTAEEQAEAEYAKSREEARPLTTLTRPISYGTASEIAGIVQATALSAKGSIIIDQRTNTLVITEVDIEEYRERILNLIRILDSPTPQVEIEARIVETSKTWAKGFGIQWGFNRAFDATSGSTTDLVFPNSGTILGDIVKSSGGFTSRLPNSGWAVNLPGSGANAGIGFHLADITDTFQLDVALSTLEDSGQARVLSAPRITTQSNISASIQSGSSIPVQTIANNTITVQYIAAALNLNVTPQVTPDNTIILQVTVTQSTPDFGVRVGLSNLPPITTRTATTKLMVPDGGTAVIGGVFQLSEGTTQNRIPGLNQLPVLGWLFKNSEARRSNNELLIFITPKIKSLS